MTDQNELPAQRDDHVIAPITSQSGLPLHGPVSAAFLNVGMQARVFATVLTPIGLLRALRRRLVTAMGLAFLVSGVLTTGAFYLLPPARYKAEATLHVAAQQPQILFKTVETG